MKGDQKSHQPRQYFTNYLFLKVFFNQEFLSLPSIPLNTSGLQLILNEAGGPEPI
jgi:hypothetical protein